MLFSNIEDGSICVSIAIIVFWIIFFTIYAFLEDDDK